MIDLMIVHNNVIRVQWCCSFFVIDREELKSAQMTQIDIGFYIVPSPDVSFKHFTLTIGEIKV